jgi:hypothetical protein
MMMTARDRLARSAESVRVLALGDSLAMTQFQPDLFARMVGLQQGEVFNAAYLGMSFPSQADLLDSVDPERFAALTTVLYFVNPRRLAEGEVPSTDVLRVGIRPRRVPWDEAWRTGRVAPILDASRLYGLSRHLVVSAWREALHERPSWDHVEYLGPNGGVAWAPGRASANPPRYPHPPLAAVSPERMAEMRRVVTILRETGAEVWLVPSALHPAIRPYASERARAELERALDDLARDTGARHLGDALSGFAVADDRDFCDYGHMNAAGGDAYTRHLAAREGLRLAARRSWRE